MGRAARVDVEGGVYHVMNRGVNHAPVFFDDCDRVRFGELLGLAHQRFGVEVVAYCLMTNHVHLVLRCPNAHLADAMHVITSTYVRNTNDRVGRDGPLFRGRFRSIPITDDDYLLCAVRYVHNNPLDIAGVDRPDRYRWSSHRAYLGLRPVADFLRPDLVLGFFGHDRSRFDDFVRRRSETATGACVPDAALVAAAGELVLEELLGDDLSPNLIRTVLYLVADRLGPSGLAAIRPVVTAASRSAEQAALRRARRRARLEPVLGEVADRVVTLVSSRMAA